MTPPPLTLASSSARRIEILSYFSYPFVQCSPDFNEEEQLFHGDPIAYVEMLSQGKARSINDTESIILSADSIVYFDNKLYEKPKHREEATEFLTALSGQTHSVFTAVCARYQGKESTLTEETKVSFRSLTQKHIQSYLDGISFLDKAGAYAVQRSGTLIVKKVDGCFYNVMGLPIHACAEVLKDMGIDLWDYIASDSL